MKTVMKSITFTEKPIRVMIEKWLCKKCQRDSVQGLGAKGQTGVDSW